MTMWDWFSYFQRKIDQSPAAQAAQKSKSLKWNHVDYNINDISAKASSGRRNSLPSTKQPDKRDHVRKWFYLFNKIPPTVIQIITHIYIQTVLQVSQSLTSNYNRVTSIYAYLNCLVI